MGNAPIVGDGEPIPYDQGGTLWSINFPYYVTALGFAITRMAIEDSEYIDLAATFGRHLAQSLYETEEVLAANVINNGFNSNYTQLGGDSQPLFSASHGLYDGTYSNILTGNPALSQTSAEQMIIQLSQLVDSRGKKINVAPHQFVVPPQLIFQAEIILKSLLRPDTANNAINPIQSLGLLEGGMQKVTRLTSPYAWGMTTDLNAKGDMGLVRFNRRELTRKSQPDFLTDSLQFIMSMRYIFGWVDPRGIIFSSGIGG
jgi:hypothetical protein